MYKIVSIDRSIKADIKLPFSKSESNRALIIQHLTTEPIEIYNISNADDTVRLRQLLKSKETILNCGDGGTTFRFLLAYLALKGEEKIITGSNRLCNRPVAPLVDALNQMGAQITYLERENFPPLKISKGDFSKTSTIKIKASISSQFISATLLIAPVLPQGLKLVLEGKILSRSYLLLTLSMLRKNGIEYFFEDNIIEIKPQQYKANNITIGADWSAASYFYEIAAFSHNADIFLEELSENSDQGDKVVASLMKQFGVNTEIEKGGIRITKALDFALPEKFEYNFLECPDLAQTFAFMCAGLNVHCKLTGLDNLSVKETNRTEALKNEISKLGNKVITTTDTIEIMPSDSNFDTELNMKSYNDHRMIMSAVPLTVLLKSFYFNDIEDVTKSFPHYWDEVFQLGINKIKVI